MIKLNDISKGLGTFHIKQISFELPPGYILGLIGPNGAGKTTLLHLILGLYRPDGGSILVDGKSYETKEREIREILGTVLAEELFEGADTLLQNAERYGKYYSRYDRPLLLEYLDRFSLSPDKKQRELSRGEMLKFQFAFALAHHPKLLVLDEPTGNFDPEFRDEFFALLKEFIADGTNSVILATHLTEDLDRIADYILYLDRGKQVFAGDIETLREQYRLVAGETYKIKLIPKEQIIYMEETAYGTKALIYHRRRNVYDAALAVTVPTIEELMYFITKGRGKRC